jgi:hypothetical protein
MARIHDQFIDPRGRFYFEDGKALKAYLMPRLDVLVKKYGLTRLKYGDNQVWTFEPTSQQIAVCREQLQHLNLGEEPIEMDKE